MSAASLEVRYETPSLSRSCLHRLPVRVRRPSFDPASLQAGILHLGCGAFHRAHQAVYTQRAIEAEAALVKNAGAPPRWGIASASLRSSGVVDALRRQDGLYSVLERSDSGSPTVEVIGSLVRAMYLGVQAQPWVRWFCDPHIHVVSLTVTQAGYCTDPVTGRLDASHADIVADLSGASASSAIGLLVLGLASRRTLGMPPPVVLSRDNVPHNGELLRRACIDFAALTDDGLSRHIEQHVQFPSTMVDRIVPVASDDDRRVAARALGVRDVAAVSAEPYLQWVIESFDGPRPRWDAVGAQFVGDVGPWEASKLRLLNGGHLALAFLGLLDGVQTVSQAMARPYLASFALRFMLEEQRPTLPPSDHDIAAYAQQLLQRWRNPEIVHCLDRITRDSDRKLAPRLLDALRDNLRVGRATPCTELAVAAWMCREGHVESCQALEDNARLVERLIETRSIFGDDLPRVPGLRRRLLKAVGDLRRRGVEAAIDRCLTEPTC